MQLWIKSFDGTLHSEEHLRESLKENRSFYIYPVSIDFLYKILFGGQILEDGCNLSEYGITNNSTLHLTAPILGGGKKRKKKNYSTPKRIKHKPKKIKMRVLKYYKVQKDGSVKRVLSNCTQCGPGIFLANHKDRLYCGRCCASTRKATAS